MIKTNGFKRAFLMPSNRRPRVSSLNYPERGYTIRSDGRISNYPSADYFTFTILSRYRLFKPFNIQLDDRFRNRNF